MNLVCTGVDGKLDSNTFMYCEVNDEEGNIRLKIETGKEHHMTVTKESGEGSGTYLTHRDLRLKGATGHYQATEVLSVLEEFDSIDSLQAVLLDNTSTNT